jgi:hypothetical protein
VLDEMPFNASAEDGDRRYLRAHSTLREMASEDVVGLAITSREKAVPTPSVLPSGR